MDRDAILLKCCETYAHLAMVISHADGVLRPQEGRAVAKGLNEFLDRVAPGPSVRAAVPGLLRDTARAVAAGQKDGSLAASTDAVLGFGVQLPIELRRDLLASLRSVAASDGSVSPEEGQVLARIERAWSEEAASAPRPAPAKTERKAPGGGGASPPNRRPSANVVDAFNKGVRPGGGSSERASPRAAAHPGDCTICGEEIAAGEDCAWCAPSGDSIDLGRQWSIRLPAMWSEDPEQCESINKAGMSFSRYFGAGRNRFGLYVVQEGELMSRGGIENADKLARTAFGAFEMELIHVSDVTISGRSARILDGRDAKRGHLISTVLFEDAEGVTRFSFHDYVSRDADRSVRTREQILGALVKGAAGAGAKAASAGQGTSAGKSGPASKAGFAIPTGMKPGTGSKAGQAAPNKGIDQPAATPSDEVSEKEVQELVLTVLATRIKSIPGIGSAILTTILRAGETYTGLHELLSAGVPALKKCQGIGQKKAEAIAAAYKELGGRQIMELAARQFILKKRRADRVKRILSIIGWIVAALFAFVALTSNSSGW